MKNIIYIAVLVYIVVWAGNKLHQKYINAEKKPFWTGTQEIQVCKKPYYSSNECYKLNVLLLNEKSTKIYFPNGGYIVTGNLTCYFAGNSGKDRPRYTFCRSWGSESNQWDFMPSWVNY